MPVRRIEHDHVAFGIHQRQGAVEAGIADRRRRRDPKPPLLVLAGIGMKLGLLDILHRDEADAVIVVVHHEKLLDPVLVQEPAGLVAGDALADRDQIFLGHQLGDALATIGGEADVAVGDDPDELAGRIAALDHRDAGDPVALHQVQGLGQGLIRSNRHRIDHHAGFELLDLLDLLGLFLVREIAMDHADAARLGHGDGEIGLGDGVHRR